MSPVVILGEEEAEEGPPVVPPPLPPHPPASVNGDFDLVEEKDPLVEQLEEQLSEAQRFIQALRSEFHFKEKEMRDKISALEHTVSQLSEELHSERDAKKSALSEIESAAASAIDASEFNQEQSKRKSAEEKFTKMKELYQKLRDEHINLIRTVSKCF